MFKKSSARSVFAQLAFIWLAFITMVATSYAFVSDIEHKHLVRDASDALASIKSSIEADLLESETLLRVISFNVKNITDNNGSAETMHKFVRDVSASVVKDDNRHLKMEGVYGYFDIYNKYIDSEDWVPESDYIPQERPWYIAAVEAGGEVVATKPYIDMRTNEIVLSYACQILGDDGKQIAVVAIDILLNTVADEVIKLNLAEGGYGVLLDGDNAFIAHPDKKYIGKNIKESESFIAANLERDIEIDEYEYVNFQGNTTIVFFRNMKNNWHIGLLTPKNQFYYQMNQMGFVISVIGAGLAGILTFIFINIAKEKENADKRMRIMLNMNPLVVNFWNNERKNVDCNDEAIKLFGMDSREEYLERFYELSPEYQPNGRKSEDYAMELVEKTFEEGYLRIEWLHQKLNGELIPCEVTLVRVESDDDFIVVAYVRDLREFKKMLSEMRRVEIAEESNKAKSRFLAMMSHEIRTPLTAILGVADIQLRDVEHRQETKDAFNTIASSGSTLLNIINDILDMSKIESGKLEIKCYQYELVSMINDTIQLNVVCIGNKRIKFEVLANENLPAELIGDELRIKQVLNNLLSNAFKYTDEGEVALSVDFENGRDNSDAENITLIIRVSDTGHGMSKKQIHEIFEEYSRIETSANRTTMGTGLGMNITNNIVKLMDGDIKVESELGKGSVFIVRLPQGICSKSVIGKDAATRLRDFHFNMLQLPKKAKVDIKPMPNGKVLIVDDMKTNLHVAKGLMMPYSLKIDTAVSGFEAIDIIKSGKVYDIVFMDHMMPKMDGIETVKKIRALGYKAPIIALTANVVSEQTEIFKKNGFDGLITKPIDVVQLNALLNRLIKDKSVNDVQPLETNAEAPERDLKEIFAQDAENVIKELEALCADREEFSEDELQLYAVDVCAIRHALKNIGETELPKIALKLETAGKNKNIAIIKKETPAFLNKLRAFMK